MSFNTRHITQETLDALCADSETCPTSAVKPGGASNCSQCLLCSPNHFALRYKDRKAFLIDLVEVFGYDPQTVLA